MAALVIALTLVSCGSSAASPSASPQTTGNVTYWLTAPPTVAPVPTATPFAHPTLDPRRVVIAMSAEEQARPRAEFIITTLPKAWSLATRGRSEVMLVSWTEWAPIYLTVVDGDRVAGGIVRRGQTQALAGGRIQLVTVFRTVDEAQLLRVVLHELGHALGCCTGPNTLEGHWIGCETEILCERHAADAYTFSDRELAQMRLGH